MHYLCKEGTIPHFLIYLYSISISKKCNIVFSITNNLPGRIKHDAYATLEKKE